MSDFKLPLWTLIPVGYALAYFMWGFHKVQEGYTSPLTHYLLLTTYFLVLVYIIAFTIDFITHYKYKAKHLNTSSTIKK